MLVVFIAGASASGKTKFAGELFATLQAAGIRCFSMKLDDYYKEIPEGVDFAQYKNTTNFDHPDCLDFMLLKKHIVALRQGQPIEKPVFDFKIERRVKTERVEPPDILLLDGTSALFFAQHFLPDLQKTYKVFLEADQDVLLKRRIRRDLLERGYTDEASILKKDAEFVRPTFKALIEPARDFADLLVNNNGGHSLKAAVRKTMEACKEILI
jgi:uridine kinase